MRLGTVFENFWKVECFRKGKLIWVEEFPNLIVNEGLDDVLDKYFKGSAYTAAWYCGLVNNAGFTAYAAGDTAAQIGGTNGWAESAAYDEANRPTLTLGAVSGQSVDNSASKASFTMNATVTIRGAFIATSNVKSGTAGKIYGEGDFSAARAVVDNDVLNVTITLTSASA